MTKPAILGSLLVAALLVACQGGESGLRTDDSAPADAQTTSRRALVRPATVQLTRADARGIALRVDGGGVRAAVKVDHGRLFSTLDCDGCGVTNEIGKPRLPAVRRLVEVPPGSSLAVRLDGPAPRVVPLAQVGARHPVVPVQRPVVKLPGARERARFVIDQALYDSDGFYPAESYHLSKPLWVRGHQLVLVEYYPVRYNPVRGLIEVDHAASLELDFVAGAAPAARRVDSTPAFERWFHRSVIGSKPRAVRATSTAKYAEGILVVVGDTYADDAGLLAYVEARRDEGNYVQVVAMSDVGSTDADLRAYVQGEYLSWSEPALSYVVLVGDVADVPTHQGAAGSDGGQATDLYYASIDPDDYASDLLAPDLMISRISVDDLSQLGTYVDRADRYIRANFPDDESWLHKVAFSASCDQSDVTEGTHDYVIDTYTAAAGFTGIIPDDPQAGGDKLYCSNGDAGAADILAALNDGRVVVNDSGHGIEYEWADPEFGESDLESMAPADAAPFVVSNACLTGSFDWADGDCWGEMWLHHPHGAILYWGATNYTFWDQDDILERRMWDGIFADGITRIADITHNAKLQLLAHYGAESDMEYYFEIYNMLGDGTIDLYTDVPVDPTVLYPATIMLGMSTIDVSVEDGGAPIEGALVSVRGGVVQQVGYTDAAGQVTLAMDPIPDTVGDLKVTVTGHNLRRYQGTIQVIPADGPYLVHDSHAITSDGTSARAPNPGAHVVMPITVENVGPDAATGITATLSTTSDLVTITQEHPVFGDVAAEATGQSTTHAEFDIDPAAADRASILFQLDWTTTTGESGFSRFTVAVERPILLCTAHAVSDADGGCDSDDIADVSEPTEFALTIENQGSGDASGLTVTLAGPDCTVSEPVAIADLAAGAETTAVFTVIPQASVDCPVNPADFTVTVASAELPVADQSSFDELLNADIEASQYSDDIEGTEPNGWSHSADVGSDDWAYTTDDSHSDSHSWFAVDTDGLKDASLVTPSITIGETAELRFWHKYDFEQGWDGGVLEISTDGGTTYGDLGSFITSNGYDSSLQSYSENPIAGRSAWSGSADWQEVVVDLSSFGPGDITVRFRLGCDGYQGADGWWIDDVTVDAETVICQTERCANLAPVADAGPDQEVHPGDPVTLAGSASDPEGDTLSYSWVQRSGSTVTLADASTLAPSFTAVAGEDLVFELTVSDGQLDVSDTVTIAVSSGDAGCCSAHRDNPGGSLFLALLCLVALSRRRRVSVRPS